MQNNNIILRLLIEYLSKTSIGEDIQYVIESEQRISNLSDTLMSHIIKFELATNSEPKNGRLNTIKKQIINIKKDRWFNEKKPQAKYNILKYPLNNFNLIYSNTRDLFNTNLVNNQIQFPKICPDDKKNSVLAKYRWIVDQIIDDNENINTEIKDYFKIK